MREKSNTVYRTDNYNMFKRLPGNRDVTEVRKKRIIKSIEEVGYIQCPIIVNDRMEVIDGQGRIEALRELGLPVDYIVVSGIGRKECTAMNVYQSNWTLMDYIQCYAECGNNNYAYLLQLIHKHKRYLAITPIIHAATGMTRSGGDSLKRETLKMNEKLYAMADAMLSYEERFTRWIKGIGGRIDAYYVAIGFLYLLDSIDNELLEKNVERYRSLLDPAEGVETAVASLENAYNQRNRNKVYVVLEWKRAQEAGSWYRKIWK